MMKMLLLLISILLCQAAYASELSLAQKRLEKEKAICSSEASRKAYWLLGFNGNWNAPYNECLRRRATKLAQKLVTIGTKFIGLQNECYGGIIPQNEPLLDLSIMNIHIFNKYSVEELRKPQTNERIEEAMLDFHKRIMKAERGIKRLSKK